MKVKWIACKQSFFRLEDFCFPANFVVSNIIFGKSSLKSLWKSKQIAVANTVEEDSFWLLISCEVTFFFFSFLVSAFYCLCFCHLNLKLVFHLMMMKWHIVTAESFSMKGKVLRLSVVSKLQHPTSISKIRGQSFKFQKGDTGRLVDWADCPYFWRLFFLVQKSVTLLSIRLHH